MGEDSLRPALFFQIWDILLLRLYLNFLKSFGIERETNIYREISLFLTAFGVIISGFSSIGWNYSFPASLAAGPLMIFGVMYVACFRDEFDELWDGVKED